MERGLKRLRAIHIRYCNLTSLFCPRACFVGVANDSANSTTFCKKCTRYCTTSSPCNSCDRKHRCPFVESCKAFKYSRAIPSLLSAHLKGSCHSEADEDVEAIPQQATCTAEQRREH